MIFDSVTNAIQATQDYDADGKQLNAPSWALARRLAERIDSPEISATELAKLARELQNVLNALGSNVKMNGVSDDSTGGKTLAHLRLAASR